MKNLLLIIGLCLYIFNNSFAQDTIWLINGKKYELKDYIIDNKLRKLFYKNKKDKDKFFYIDHIFSIKDTSGNENIYFSPRKIDTTFYSIDNMRSYITGFDDAENEYKTCIATSSGFLVGGLSTFAFTVPFYAIIPIATYTTAFGLTKPSKKKIIETHPARKNDNFYIEGYRESATGKRTWNTLKGAFIGIIIGVTTSIIINSN